MHVSRKQQQCDCMSRIPYGMYYSLLIHIRRMHSISWRTFLFIVLCKKRVTIWGEHNTFTVFIVRYSNNYFEISLIIEPFKFNHLKVPRTKKSVQNSPCLKKSAIFKFLNDYMWSLKILNNVYHISEQ